ncbi:MAG: hypothetical protein ACAI44_01050 [Candidatus Sericytochromatia bacterium]
MDARIPASTLGLVQSLQNSAVFQRIAGRDGNAGDLSALDLSKSYDESDDIQALCGELRANGYDVSEQGLIQAIEILTQDEAINLEKGTYQAFDFKTGDVAAVSFPPGPQQSTGGREEQYALSAVRRQINDPALRDDRKETVTDYAYTPFPQTRQAEPVAYIHDRKKVEPGLDPTPYINDDHDETVDAALAARERLIKVYGMPPQVCGELGMVAALKGKIPPDQMADFIETFMTANYAHAGNIAFTPADGDYRSGLIGQGKTVDVLPDGRGLIDCGEYARIAGILLRTLAGADSPEHFIKEVSGPGHAMAFIKVGEQGYLVDNNSVRPLTLSADELQSITDAEYHPNYWGTPVAQGVHGELPAPLFREVETAFSAHHAETYFTSDFAARWGAMENY